MATITASAAGGPWTVGATWVGGVAPTAADDAVLNGTSGNVSIPTATTVAARSLTCTGYTGTLTWASATAILEVGDAGGGNVTFVAGMTVTLTGIGTLRLRGAGAATYTLTTAGKNMPNITVLAGASSVYQLADNLTAPGANITLSSGTLDTTSKTISAGSFISSGTSARTMTLGSSSMTFSLGTGWNFSATTGLTITANTATATLTATNAQFAGGGFNYNGLSVVINGAGNGTVSGTNTFANLNRTGTGTIDSHLVLSADQTITGTLTLAGNSLVNRLWVRSNTAGTARTLTVTGAVVASYVDFTDTVGAGAASWNLSAITGGSGDALGNSGITFTSAVTRYAVATGNWATFATWSATSGGAGGATSPLPQDTAILNAASGAINVTMNMQRHAKDIIASGFAGTLTLTSSATQRYIFGSLTLGSGMTFAATPSFTFAGRGSHTIDMAGKAFTAAVARTVNIGEFGGTYTLLSDANFGTSTTAINSLQIQGGVTFNANNFNVTSPSVIVTATVNMGSGTWSLMTAMTGAAWNNVGGTINAGTSSIVIVNPSVNTRNFAGGGATYYDFSYVVAGSTGQLTVTGANTFRNFNFSDASNARTLAFTAGTTTTFTGAFNVFGTPGNLMTVTSATAANHNLTKASGVVSSDYLSISRSQAVGGAAWYAGANSVDGGNNSGWIFTAPPALTQGNFFLMF